MFIAAVGCDFEWREVQPIPFAAGMRGHDPGGELLESRFHGAIDGGQIEYPVVGSWRLIGLYEEAAASRVRAPGHLARRIAAAEFAQAHPFFVAGAMHRGSVATRGRFRWRLAAAARHRPGEQGHGCVQIGPRMEEPERKRGGQIEYPVVGSWRLIGLHE